MDDHDTGSGLSGWAWYRLGQASARRQVSVAETVTTLLRRRQPSIDINAVISENRTLASDNAYLRNELQVYAQNYNTLRAWAERAEKRLKAFEEKEMRL